MPLDQRERQSPKSIVGRVGAGSRSSGCLVVVCFVVCASGSLRGAKRHRTAALFRVSVASHLPARVAIVGLICAMASVALPASDRRNSTSAISRLAHGGCWVVIKKSEVFASLHERVRSLFNSAFWNQILHPSDGLWTHQTRGKQRTWKMAKLALLACGGGFGVGTGTEHGQAPRRHNRM